MPWTTRQNEPAVFQIIVRGHVDEGWSDWLGGLTVNVHGSGETLLTGPIRDQAALHGLLNKIRDLGLPLVSIEQTRMESG